MLKFPVAAEGNNLRPYLQTWFWFSPFHLWYVYNTHTTFDKIPNTKLYCKSYWFILITSIVIVNLFEN